MHVIRNFFDFIGKAFLFFFKAYIFLVIVVSIIGLCFGIVNEEDNDNTKLADGFTIEEYNVILDVKKDNKVNVTEEITVNFESSFKHGIYKFTPQWLKYTGKDGKTLKRKALVIDYRAEGENYSLDKVKKKARIKIGDANRYVNQGLKTYVIKYTYDMGKDPYKGFDEFIFHAYGDYWGTEIKNASIEVNMPKDIEGYNINFFTDKVRINNVNNVVDYEVRGNTLKAKFNAEKNQELQYKLYCESSFNQNEDGSCDDRYFKYDYTPLEKSLTVDIELPEGYFEGGSWNYGFGSLFISIIIFFLTGWTIVRWFNYGKDHAKKAATIEFYPPDNLSAAEIGYIFNNKQSNKKLTISLIIQLASKGYIRIDEIGEKKKQIQITNLKIAPKKLKDFDSTLPKREIEIEKLKDEDNNLSSSEKTMMKYLFKNGATTKKLKSNINNFLSVKDSLVQRGYIQILNDNELERLDGVEEKRKEYEKQQEQYEKDRKQYEVSVEGLSKMSSLEKIVYDRLFETKNEIILSEHHTFYKAFRDVDSKLQSSFIDKVWDRKATNQLVGAIIRNIAIIILSMYSYSAVEDLDPNLSIIYGIAFLCIFINLFFTIFMKRKTEYGELITARVKGFRNFLNTAEKSKLEALVAENPEYYYNILPYTYALNISRKWIKKFENIPLPENNMGSFDYSRNYSYYSLYDNIYYPPSSSGSGSSSSCGGGCSSCGGGCSSCGGGGSW